MYNNNFRSRNRGFGGGRSFARRTPRPANGINTNLFVNKAVEIPDQVSEPITHQFSDFSLNSQIVESVAKRGYLTPTIIQDKSIPLIMGGHDVIGIADTGTGKTAAFLLPLMHKFLKDRSQKALIIVPTHELAVQIEEDLRVFARGMNMFSALCVGGSGYGGQLNALRRNPQFVIGTPGRLKDHVGRRSLRLHDFNNLVLDEADRMVEMGFISDVRELISHLPTERQSLFFSATITPEVRSLISQFTRNPESVSVKSRETSQNVDQNIVHYTDQFHKMSILEQLLAQEDFKKVLIFGRTKHGVEKLNQSLAERGFSAVSIHGNKTHSQRQRSLDEFKNGRTQIMVATDVAARGLDIPNVSHVINFELPESYSDYVHRIGRTGRANQQGKALTFVVGAPQPVSN